MEVVLKIIYRNYLKIWIDPNQIRKTYWEATQSFLIKQKERKKELNTYIHTLKYSDCLIQFDRKPLHFFFFFNFILFLNFTILYWFYQIPKWIRHRYTCVPHPEPSSILPPHTIPLGHPSVPAPSIPYRASNLDWWLVSYMILYMFQCHSPCQSEWLRSKSLQSINAGEGVEKREPSYTVGGNAN